MASNYSDEMETDDELEMSMTQIDTNDVEELERSFSEQKANDLAAELEKERVQNEKRIAIEKQRFVNHMIFVEKNHREEKRQISLSLQRVQKEKEVMEAKQKLDEFNRSEIGISLNNYQSAKSLTSATKRVVSQ